MYSGVFPHTQNPCFQLEPGQSSNLIYMWTKKLCDPESSEGPSSILNIQIIHTGIIMWEEHALRFLLSSYFVGSIVSAAWPNHKQTN